MDRKLINLFFFLELWGNSMKKKSDTLKTIKEQPSQGGRVMRQMRQEESVAKALKSNGNKKVNSSKSMTKEY
jgi:hypothetical protein